jgi:hypothetical protein
MKALLHKENIFKTYQIETANVAIYRNQINIFASSFCLLFEKTLS